MEALDLGWIGGFLHVGEPLVPFIWSAAPSSCVLVVVMSLFGSLLFGAAIERAMLSITSAGNGREPRCAASRLAASVIDRSCIDLGGHRVLAWSAGCAGDDRRQAIAGDQKPSADLEGGDLAVVGCHIRRCPADPKDHRSLLNGVRLRRCARLFPFHAIDSDEPG